MVTNIVGRDEAIEVIDGFIERSSKFGHSLLIVGEPGLGKTTLLQYADRRWRADGGRVLQAGAVEFEADISFAGVQQIFSSILDSIPAVAGTYAQILQALFDPNTALALDRLAVTEALRMLLHVEARSSPVLILVDDLQWIDRSSAAVLTLLARRLTGIRVGFVGATHPDAEGFFDRARIDEYELTPLSEQAAADILSARYPELAPAIRRRVLATAAGNPLALVELPLALSGSGHASRTLDPSIVPLNRRLQVTFASRLEALDDETRRVLLLAALEGTGSLGVLERAHGGSLLDLLAPAETAHLVRVDEVTSRLVFGHPLTRSAVVAGSTASQRRQAHRQLAAALSDDPDRQAWHLAQGTAGRDERAATSLEEVAYRLAQRGDTVGAVVALIHASTLSPAKSDEARRLASAAYLGAHLGGGLAAASDTLREAQQVDPRAAGSLDAATASAFVILNADGDIATAHRLLAGALESVRTDATATYQLRSALYTMLFVCFWGGRAELWTAFDPVLARLSDPGLATLRISRKTYADPAFSTPSDYDALDARIAQLDSEIDPAEVVSMTVAGFWVDRLGDSRAVLERALHQGRDADDMNVVTQALSLLGFEAFFAGHWADAERYLAEADKLMDKHGFRLYRWSVQYGIAVLAAVHGDDASVQTITDELIRWATPRGALIVRYLCHHARTLSALGRQDYEAAYREASAISPPGTIPPHRPLALWVVLDLVDAAIRTNHRDDAVAHVTAVRQAGIGAISGRLALLVAAAEALVAVGSEADGHYERALAVPDAARWPFEQARVELLYGQHLRRKRERRSARPHLDEALAAFERLGAKKWAETARQELRAAGQRTGPQPKEGTLTGREHLIAQMAATGMSNKEIGEELFLSARTIGAHLYRIFPKLGITSRAGLRDALTRIDKNREP